jgi:hypothetical protein
MLAARTAAVVRVEDRPRLLAPVADRMVVAQMLVARTAVAIALVVRPAAERTAGVAMVEDPLPLRAPVVAALAA